MRQKKTHNLIVRLTDTERFMVKAVANSMNLNQSEMILSLVSRQDRSLQRRAKRLQRRQHKRGCLVK